MALCVTSFVRKIEDFDVVMGLLRDADVPLQRHLLSGPRFPDSLQWIVQIVPLYHAVEMLRQLTTGAINRA